MFSTATFMADLSTLAWAARFTLLVSVLGIALGLVIGALICAARLSRNRVLRGFAALWVSFLRGVPLLVQLLLAYYLLPVIGIDVPAMVAAVVTLGICASAYISEIWRGAIAALPPGQAEAAEAIGMRPRDIWTRILLPQAITMSLPALINELILLVKASSLVSVVGILEVTRMSQAIAGSTFRPLEAYLAAGCIYLVINLCLATFGRVLERRLAV
ncbi:amino acid ABC transporter permease [Paracoccus pacificus]|uniref:Amino acid ABC transporter permease n=1 Tax=Paracoccus pacificus TaxID=1463598 RepID=A0ABW4RAR5_9RHOB